MAKRQGVWKRGSFYHYGFVHPTTGEYIRRSSKSTLEHIAVQKLNQAKSDADKGLALASSNSMTVQRLVDWCWDNYWGLKERADKDSRYLAMKVFLEKFGQVKAGTLTPDMLREYMAERIKTVKRRTVQIEFTHLSCAYNQAINNDKLIKNPFKKIPADLFKELGEKRKVSRSRDRIATQDEINLLLGHSAGMLNKIIDFALNSGLRKGQIENLRREDVDFVNKKMAVQTGKGGRGYRTYEVILFDRAAEILKSLPTDTEYFFTNPDGNKIPVNGLVHAGFPRLVNRCGIQGLKFHDLRHTFATNYLRQASDMKTARAVQHILGHTTFKTTEIYLNLKDEDFVTSNGFKLGICHNNVTKSDKQICQTSKVVD